MPDSVTGVGARSVGGNARGHDECGGMRSLLNLCSLPIASSLLCVSDALLPMSGTRDIASTVVVSLKHL